MYIGIKSTKNVNSEHGVPIPTQSKSVKLLLRREGITNIQHTNTHLIEHT